MGNNVNERLECIGQKVEHGVYFHKIISFGAEDGGK